MAYPWRKFFITGIFILTLSGILSITIPIHAAYQPPIPPAPGEFEVDRISFYEPSWDTHIDLSGGKGGKLDFYMRGERWSYKTSLGDTKEAQQAAIREWASQEGHTILADIPGYIVTTIQQGLGEKKLLKCVGML